MFYWKGHFFQTAVNNNSGKLIKLEVKWRSDPDASASTSSSPAALEPPESAHTIEDGEKHCFDFDSNDILKDCYYSEHTFHEKQQHTKPVSIFSDVFNLGKNKEGHIITTGFSFDHTALCRVPVILAELGNVSKHSGKHNRFAHQQLEPSCSSRRGKCVKLLLLGIIDNALSKTRDVKEKRFSIVPLRLFNLPSPCESMMLNLESARFISDYGLFCLDKSDDHTLSFQILFGHHDTSTDIIIQNFISNDSRDTRLSKSDIVLMDIHNSFVNKMILAVVQWTDSQSHPKCGAFLFYNLYNTRYKMIRTEMDLLFPSEFEQIAEKVVVMSLSTTKSPPRIKSSSVVVLSTTKYAIRFSDGVMTHCVSMDKGSCIYQNVEEKNERKLKAIDCSCRNEPKTAFHINDICFLIDWTSEKITWQHPERVHMIGQCGNGLSDVGKTWLSIVFDTESDENDLAKWMISTVDVSEVKSDEVMKEDVNGGEGRNESINTTSHSSFHSQKKETNDDGPDARMDDGAKNVLSGLLFQEKKCQLDVADLEQSIRCKEIFIQQTLKRFSDLKDDGNSSLSMKHVDMPPLVPVTDHTELSGRGQCSSNPCPKHWKVKKLWKITIDRFLVCGVDLVKLCPSSNLCDIHLILVPINPCRTVTHSKSLLTHTLLSHLSSSSSNTPTSSSTEPSSPPMKRTCLAKPPYNFSNSLNSNVKTSPLSLTVSAFLNTQGFWGCEDINVQVYLSYTEVQGADRSNVTSDIYKIDCGIVSVSRKEKLEESCCLRSSVKKCCGGKGDILTLNDVTALDCVQTSLDLRVSSILTPVTSLLEKVKGHPSMTFLPRFDQYIYTADHQRLLLCRLKWLNQTDRRNAIIRVFSQNQDDLLLFIEFLDFIASSDTTLHLHEAPDDKSKIKPISVLSEALHGKVEQSIPQTNKDLEKVTIPIPPPVIDVDEVEIVSDFPSPKFPSSIQKTNDKVDKVTEKPDNLNPSTSGIGLPAPSKPLEKVRRRSTTSEDMDDDINLFDFGTGFASKAEVEGRKRKGLGTKKNSKSKLTTMKKK